MTELHDDKHIRVLIADDDEHILDCYREAFCPAEATGVLKTLLELDLDLFDPDASAADTPSFEVTACCQGDEAVRLAKDAAREGHPFDVVILDVRMPPGIDGVEAGTAIRKFDSNIEIVFVSGYSDIPFDELQHRVPPPRKLHYFSKPLSFMQLAEDVAAMVRA